LQNAPQKTGDEAWDVVIRADRSSLSLRLNELWKYRDLLKLFVKRDFIATYKQTVLGPLWFFLQPLLTALTFTIVFGSIAKLSTAGYPKMLFYLSGITAWNYFADCLVKTSSTFISNANLFSKVYFPRLIVPLSVITSNLMRFMIQLLLLVAMLVYYMVIGAAVSPNIYLLLFPFLLIIMAGLGLGFGILISSLTTKYRDLQFLVAFGVSLMMYVSPVIFPLETITNPTLLNVVMANPMTSVIETFRYAMLGGTGEFNMWLPLAYSTGFMLVLLLCSLAMFNRVQRTFMDTV
jgi:lipopolysaccharide transport system permease protein